MQEDASGMGKKIPPQTKEVGLISTDSRSGVLLVRRFDAAMIVSVVRIEGTVKETLKREPEKL